jgi:hypothetical protein
MSLNYATRAIAQVTGAPTPATSGTSFSVSSGQGARFVSGTQERRGRLYEVDSGLVEIVTITNRSTDTFTVTRNADAGGAQTITASGWVLEDIDDLGPSHVLAYDAGFFSAAGGGSITVAAGDVSDHAWTRVGYTVWYRIKLITITVTGTVNSIGILFPTAALPSGAQVAQGSYPVVIFDNSSSVGVLGNAFWAAAATGVTITKADGTAFAVSTNNTSLSFYLPVVVA